MQGSLVVYDHAYLEEARFTLPMRYMIVALTSSRLFAPHLVRQIRTHPHCLWGEEKVLS